VRNIYTHTFIQSQIFIKTKIRNLYALTRLKEWTNE